MSKASRTRSAERPAPTSPSRKGPIVAAVVGLAVVAALVVAVVTSGSHDPAKANATGAAEVHPVQVVGQPLPAPPDSGTDPAIGQRPPELSGQSFDGTRVAIVPGGKSKLVIFVAHWCPHCRAEIPRIVQWLASGKAPTNLDVLAVSTAVNRSPINYPPSAWLAREHLTVPILADDAASSAAAAWGLPGYPYLVLLKTDGTLAARTSGEFADAAALDNWVKQGMGGAS